MDGQKELLHEYKTDTNHNIVTDDFLNSFLTLYISDTCKDSESSAAVGDANMLICHVTFLSV